MRSPLVRLALAAGVAILVAGVRPVHAEGFISPFVGYNFGGDAGCPTISGCDDKNLNLGVGLGTMGKVFGFEEEFAYAKDFFGSASGLDSSVLTLMSNVMLAPDLGVVRPYALVGLGLVRSHVSFGSSSVLTVDNNNLGWDVGGGLMISIGRHVGLRGDVRYIHSLQDLSVLGFTLSDTKLDFGRASGGLVLKF